VDALVGEALGVPRVGEQGVGEMGAADRLARDLTLFQGRVVELEAELAQPVGHRVDAPAAVGAEVLQQLEQRRVGDVDLVAEDVQVLVRAVDGGQLGGGGEADAVLARGGLRLRDAVDGVVVGQREQLHAGGRRAGDHVGGRQRAVGVHGVRLQVEGRGHPGSLRFGRDRAPGSLPATEREVCDVHRTDRLDRRRRADPARGADVRPAHAREGSCPEARA
jgi:hypothetical protein